MESKTKFFGHALHPLLIVFPLGLLLTSVIFDGLAVVTHNRKLSLSAFYMLGAGVLSGLTASIFGLIDWVALPENTRAKRIGLTHGLTNTAVSMLFGTSWLLRRDDPHKPTNTALLLSVVGSALAGFGGWLGGELVERLGVGIDSGANLNAPNSLTGQPAGESTVNQYAQPF